MMKKKACILYRRYKYFNIISWFVNELNSMVSINHITQPLYGKNFSSKYI